MMLGLVFIGGFVGGYACCTLYFEHLMTQEMVRLKEFIRNRQLANMYPENQDDQG